MKRNPSLKSQACRVSIIKRVLQDCNKYDVRATAIFGSNDNRGGWGDKLQWLRLNDKPIAER